MVKLQIPMLRSFRSSCGCLILCPTIFYWIYELSHVSSPRSLELYNRRLLQAYAYAALPNTDSNSEKLTSPVPPRSNELTSRALLVQIKANNVRAMQSTKSEEAR